MCMKGHSLDDIPPELTPLEKARRLLDKTSLLGWVWHSHADAAGKVREELDEAEEAAGQDDREHLIEECGDVLFSAISYVCSLGVDPAAALDRANRKFAGRFNYIEEKMRERGLSLDVSHEAEESALWQEAKKQGL